MILQKVCPGVFLMTVCFPSHTLIKNAILFCFFISANKLKILTHYLKKLHIPNYSVISAYFKKYSSDTYFFCEFLCLFLGFFSHLLLISMGSLIGY